MIISYLVRQTAAVSNFTSWQTLQLEPHHSDTSIEWEETWHGNGVDTQEATFSVKSKATWKAVFSNETLYSPNNPNIYFDEQMEVKQQASEIGWPEGELS